MVQRFKFEITLCVTQSLFIIHRRAVYFRTKSFAIYNRNIEHIDLNVFSVRQIAKCSKLHSEVIFVVETIYVSIEKSIRIKWNGFRKCQHCYEQLNRLFACICASLLYRFVRCVYTIFRIFIAFDESKRLVKVCDAHKCDHATKHIHCRINARCSLVISLVCFVYVVSSVRRLCYGMFVGVR